MANGARKTRELVFGLTGFRFEFAVARKLLGIYDSEKRGKGHKRRLQNILAQFYSRGVQKGFQRFGRQHLGPKPTL